MAGSPRRHEGGRDTGDAFLDREPVLPKDADQVAGGLDLLEAQLSEAEHLIDHLLDGVAHAIDLADHLPLERGDTDGISRDARAPAPLCLSARREHGRRDTNQQAE